MNYSTQDGIIYLVDKSMDHKFTSKDLVSPKYDAFDIKIKLVISTKGGWFDLR